MLCGVFSFSAQAELPHSDEKNLPSPAAYQVCATCHGELGQGDPSLNAPLLAGQYDWYLQRQLDNFRTELRGSHEHDVTGKPMQGFAMALSAEDVETISNWLQQQTPERRISDLKGNLKNGSRYYQARCGACHGGVGEGNAAFQAPGINHLRPDYLKRQMAYFKQGIRGTEKKDKYGRQMAMMAKTVSDQELEDIIFFLNQKGQ